MWLGIGFHQNDIEQAKSLLKWIGQLNERLSHGCLLICDPSVDYSDALELLGLASVVFQRTALIAADEQISSWPAGANSLFKTAAQYMQEKKCGHWLWLEPDAIPLRSGWLDAIENAYFAAGKPFMGPLMEATEPNLPKHYLPGISVYPTDCWKRMSLAWREDAAFDVATAPVTVPFAAHTDLIQHFWGEKDLPPTFVAEKTAESPRNAFTLDKIKPEAVIFHRNKDGSLLKLLGYRERDNSAAHLDIVMPFCWMDAPLLAKSLEWLSYLNGKLDRRVILHHDGTAATMVGRIKALAGNVFSEVMVSQYPQARVTGWPNACNSAFQAACRFVQKRGLRSWFWMEADAVALRPSWLEELEQEYEFGRKPFMGTIIGNFDGLKMGHFNGGAVYPPNVAEYSRAIMTCTRQAWDTAIRDELGAAGILEICHRANHLIQQCGGVDNGCCKPINGPLPTFPTQKEAHSLVDKSVVIFHPSKDGTLIDRLSERQQ